MVAILETFLECMIVSRQWNNGFFFSFAEFGLVEHDW